MRKLSLAILLILNFNINSYSQDEFYNVDSIREIKIYFNEPNWDYILDSLYISGLKERLLASVEIDGVFYDSIGIRYKGYSSVSVNRIKNPFNIKLDYVIDNQNHRGYEKLKLSNVIQDPSFVREVLSYEIARQYMPASEANFSNVYINDTLWGLYSNIESVNKDFADKHFYSRNNSFFKGNPENLDFSGENSNLDLSPGNDTANYFPFYQLESDFGWQDLFSFIDTLNNETDSIENVLNVDRTLWMHAFNYSLINFDSYIGYAQNYYLYKDNAGRFNPILWDLNMSFGSFRLTDASLFFNGFDVTEAQTMDPLTHYNSISVYDRPLMRNLFNNDTYRRMYFAHIRTIIQENITNQNYYNRAIYFQNLIDNSVQNDTNKFYSYADFINNLNNTVSDLIDYPGITDLMDNRAIYLTNYYGYNGAPTINNVTSSTQNFNAGDNITITADITDEQNALLAYRFGKEEAFKSITMFDDGAHNDGSSGDNIYGASINNVSNTIQYYIYAENDSAGIFSPERAAYEYYSLEIPINNTDLVINELMATNISTVKDPNGEYEDWIEIYNPNNHPITTTGLLLSDNLNNTSKWNFPEVVIQGDDYLIVWLDEDGNQSGIHANFKLSSSGEELIISTNNNIIDSITYPYQSTDVSYARTPNGTGNFNYRLPSFNGNNDYANILANQKLDFRCYPNPFSDYISIESDLLHESTIEIIDLNGKQIFNRKHKSTGNNLIINTTNINPGFYIIRLTSKNLTRTQKIIKK
jgi:spore coat protein CotH